MAVQEFENGPAPGESFDDWIRREVLPELDALEADPSSGLTLEQVLAALDEDRRKALTNMLSRLKTRVPHLRDSHIVAKVGLALGLFLACAAGTTQAQSCGLTAMAETTQLVYPPIAKAAHVQGPVILLATFAQDGTVTATTTVQGPRMLEASAVTYVKGLRANEYSGPRQCPIVVTFRIVGETVECGTPSRINDQLGIVREFVRIDLQHVVTTSRAGCMNTQAAVSIAHR